MSPLLRMSVSRISSEQTATMTLQDPVQEPFLQGMRVAPAQPSTGIALGEGCSKGAVAE